MNTDRIQRLQSLLDRIKRNAAQPKQALGKGLVFGGTGSSRSDVSAGPSVPAAVQHSRTPTRTDMPIERGPQQPHAAQPVQPAPMPQMRSLKMTQPMHLTQPLQPTPASSPATASHPARVDQTPVSGRAAPAQPAPPAPSAPRAAPSAPTHAAPSAPQAAQPPAPQPAPVAAQPARPPTGTGVSSAGMQAVPSPLVAVPSVSATMVDGRRVRARVPTVIGVAPNQGGSAKAEPPPPPPQRARAPSVTFEEVDAEDVLDAVSSLPPPPEPTMTSTAAPEAGAAEQPEADVDNLSWSEPPIEVELPAPDSSRRPRVPGSIDEALAEATADSNPDVPVKTPPPESGRQPAEGVYAEPLQSPAVPTAEQLGDTVELGEPTAEELELDLSRSRVEHAPEELELELPKQPSVLERVTEPPHRAPEASQVLEIPEEADTAIMPGSSRRELADKQALELQPDVTQRPVTQKAAAIDVLQSARAFAPRSFLELLDASLKLGSR